MAQTQVHKAWMTVRRASQNPIILFTASRYLGYAMQFLRGILIAKFLGPYLFGIWGFLMLVNQYLLYTSFGLQHAIHVELAVNAIYDAEKQKKLIGVAITLAFLIAVFLAVTGGIIQMYNVNFFDKYNFSHYALAISLIVGLTHIRDVLANIYRVFGKLNRIIVSELLFALLPLLVVFVFRGEALIDALLASMVLSILMALVIYLVKSPFRITPQLNTATARSLLVVGLPLLVYTLSFALITVTGRTIISIFYSVEALGFFALANSIAAATLLGLNAVAWVVFPSLLSKTRLELPDNEVRIVVDKINMLYSTAVFIAVFSMILLAPLLFIILPQYKPVINVLSLLLLMQALLSVSFGYNTMAIARKQQMKVAIMSFISVIIVAIVGGFVGWMQLDIVWVAAAMLVGGFVFAVLQAQLGSRLLNHGVAQKGYLTSILPLGSMLAIVLFFVGSIMDYPLLFGSLGAVVFLLTRRQAINHLWSFILNKLSV